MIETKKIRSNDLWYHLDRGWEIIEVIQGFGYVIERVTLIKGIKQVTLGGSK
jgi:hypothetical protein